jgi:DNA ligase 1
MLLHELVEVSRRVTQTSSRLRKIEELSELLRRLEPTEIEVGVAYLSGELRQGRIGIGPAALRTALGARPAPAPALALLEVDRAFREMAGDTGSGSQQRRSTHLAALFGRATEEEQEFLVRLITGELRQGALQGLLAEALARASGLGRAEVRRALMNAGDLGPVAKAALLGGLEALTAFTMRLFHPVLPMLAQPADDLVSALERAGEVGLEWKLDGARVQVHKGGRDVRIFTRRLNDVTPALPEIVAAVRELPARELVLDGEVLALGPEGAPQPFQITMRRFGRKENAPGEEGGSLLTPYFFDCLYLEGAALADEPAAERWNALSASLPPSLLVPRLVPRHPDAGLAFLEAALERGHEGVMAKSLSAPYEAGRRGAAWLKVKQTHTLDLVILAAEWGHGRRSGWLSNLHLSARNPQKGSYVMLGKTFKGLTDEMLRWQTERLLALEIARDEYTVHVRPELVVEVMFGDVQASPRYPGGVALRFARVKRYRPDKRPDEADTLAAVLRLLPPSGATISGQPSG